MIYSNNEWGNLKRVVVGDATNAHWPKYCPVFRSMEKTTAWRKTPVPSGPVPEFIIQDTNNDLQKFVDLLKKLHINVERPAPIVFSKFDGMYNYCPRDRVLIIGDKIIDCPMVFPTRKLEINALSYLFDNEVITCDDDTVKFDAANISRLGNDLLYLVSSSGNYEGAKWLSKILGSKYKIHVINNIYSGVHIDSTISPVEEGLVVLNGDRINNDNIPEILKKWDKIYIRSKNIVHQDFYQYPYASNYIALNLLSLGDRRVVLDPKQDFLKFELEKRNIECYGIELRHSRTLGGGHHCVTLDLLRE